MNRNKIVKIMALATLVSAVEVTMDQGAIDSSSESDKILNYFRSDAPQINTSKPLKDSINSILDTMRLDTASVISKDLLHSYIFMQSQDTASALYTSIDKKLNTIQLNSQVITKDFIQSYIKMRVEENGFYDRDQLKSKKIIDTIPLNLKYVNRLDFDKIAFIESKYHSDAHNDFSGASGLWQLMRPTYESNGKGSFEENRFNAYKTTLAAINYLTFLEEDIPKNYNKQNAFRHKTWDMLPNQEKVDLIVMAYNAGQGTLYNKNFNPKKMPKETRGYIPKFMDADLVVSLDHLVNFNALTAFDTKSLLDIKAITALTKINGQLGPQSDSYSTSSLIAERVKSIVQLLESAEDYLSKNFSDWDNIEIQVQQELVVAATTYGPRQFVDVLKEKYKKIIGPENKEWDFRINLSRDITSRINDFNDKRFLIYTHYALDFSEKIEVAQNFDDSRKDAIKIYNSPQYPNQKIATGARQLIYLEKQLAETNTLNWNLKNADQKRALFNAAAVFGYNKFKQNNFNPLKLSKADQIKMNTINYAFEKYSRLTDYRVKLFNISRNAD